MGLLRNGIRAQQAVRRGGGGRMVQLVVTLVGTLAVTAVIAFAFGGRVGLPRFGRSRPEEPGPSPQGPHEAPEPRAESRAAEEETWRPEPDDRPDDQPDTGEAPATWQPPRARRWPLRDARGRTIGRLEQVEPRDAVVGPYLVRIEEYRLTIRTGLDHARLLEPATVAAALDGLVAAPEDECARDQAVDALTGPELWGRGGPVRQETLLLSVLACDRSARLDGVLVLRSRGVLGAGPERPRDLFDHTLARTSEAAAALAGNPALARALVDRFCPREPGPTGPLDDLILAAIRPAAA
jgi:hypothetical protein